MTDSKAVMDLYLTGLRNQHAVETQAIGTIQNELPREALERRIRDGVDAWSDESPLLVLTGRDEAGPQLRGDEGVGKTWAMAQAWLGMGDPPDRPRPMLLVMSAHAWRDGEEQTPMRLLSRLLDAQTGGSNQPHEVERWEKAA